MGLGWLRAVAQGYTYSYNKIEFGSNFQMNLISLGLQWGWGLDGGARCRKVTITVTINLLCGVIFKNNSSSWGVKCNWVWMAARGVAMLQLQLQ